VDHHRVQRVVRRVRTVQDEPELIESGPYAAPSGSRRGRGAQLFERKYW